MVNRSTYGGMNLDLTEEETAQLLRELDNIIAADKYFLSPRITTLRGIRNKIQPEPERKPPPPKYSARRVSAREGIGTASCELLL